MTDRLVRVASHARGGGSEELFRRLVESVVDYAIFMLDPTGRVATWNIGAQRIKGYSSDEIIGQHFSIFYPREDVDAGKCEMELAVASSEVGRFEDEGWRLRKDGSRFWANVVITAVRDDRGELIGFSKVTRDLTERMYAQQEQAARVAAEQANRAKDAFLAMLGHELRNPMAPILTALQLMKLKGDDRSLREQEVIERQVRHLMHLVDDLLDIARVTRGGLALKRHRHDLRTIVGRAVEVVSPLLEQRRHHFELDTPDRQLVVDGDDARLVQVFSNLINNAAKYTPPGGNLSVRIRDENRMAVVEVHDSGIGIEPEALPRIFELFVRGEGEPHRLTGGLGLGLALVRALVDMHGGAVEATSPGVGHSSVFTVRLPLVDAARPDTPVSERSVAPASRPRRILVVDDNEDARMLLMEGLEAVGHVVRGAADPVEALAVVDGFAADIALLDIGLPVMDGYELAERMREKLGATTPQFVALTGYGRDNDRARSAQAGFAKHLVKPVDLAGLLATVSELSEKK